MSSLTDAMGVWTRLLLFCVTILLHFEKTNKQTNNSIPKTPTQSPPRNPFFPHPFLTLPPPTHSSYIKKNTKEQKKTSPMLYILFFLILVLVVLPFPNHSYMYFFYRPTTTTANNGNDFGIDLESKNRFGTVLESKQIGRNSSKSFWNRRP